MTETTTPKINGLQTDLFNETKVSRRGLPKYKINPFINDSLITQLGGQKNVFFTHTTSNALVDVATGEIEPVKLQVIKTIKADKQTFLKVFTSELKGFFDLSQSAYRLLQFVFMITQNTAMNKDKIYLSLEQAQDFFIEHDKKLSRSSYFNAMKELIEKQFLAETTDINLYFINPNLFFNGDRIQFLTQFNIDNKPMLVGDLDKKQELDI